MPSQYDLKIKRMSRADNLARKNIRDLTPYSSARDEYSGSKGIFLDANENPFGKLNRYPDPHHRKLREAVGKNKGISVGNIFLGNGSDEAIDLVFRIFCEPGKDKALTFTPTYGMYEVSAAVNNVKMEKVSLDKNFNIDPLSINSIINDPLLKLIFICSPNNPTSNSFERNRIIEVIEKFNGIVVIDEAYIDFSDKGSFIPLTAKYDNLIVLQTFSKAWGAAGIRVGMAFAEPGIISYFYRVKPPYNISLLNQKAALKRLSKPVKYRNQVRKIKEAKERLIIRLKKLAIIEYIYLSDANFLLVKVRDANSVYRQLADRNIIVRNRTSVIENCLRITVGKEAENLRLIRELKKISL
jgi:histidinol-phosphate aminotransferase